jgi:hypothetical protein
VELAASEQEGVLFTPFHGRSLHDLYLARVKTAQGFYVRFEPSKFCCWHEQASALTYSQNRMGLDVRKLLLI